MHIYLKHPDHGTKVAIAEVEARADEKNGWVRYTPDSDVVPDFLNALRPKRPKQTKLTLSGIVDTAALE